MTNLFKCKKSGTQCCAPKTRIQELQMYARNDTIPAYATHQPYPANPAYNPTYNNPNFNNPYIPTSPVPPGHNYRKLFKH